MAMDLSGRNWSKMQTNSNYLPAKNTAITNYNSAVDNLAAIMSEYKKIEDKIKRWEDYLPNLENLKTKYDSVNNLANTSLMCFSSGGYMYDGKPLRGDELNAVIDSLTVDVSPESIYTKTTDELEKLRTKKEEKKKEVVSIQGDVSKKYSIAVNTPTVGRYQPGASSRPYY